jgi:NTF2 fold immunity protein of polymorphic toxin system component
MSVRTTVLSFALLCVLIVTGDVIASPRLNKWEAMQIGLDALRAKYPEEYRHLVLMYRPFVAKLEDGVWHVHGKTPIPGMAGDGAPVIEVRDRDEKVLKIYFAH